VKSIFDTANMGIDVKNRDEVGIYEKIRCLIKPKGNDFINFGLPPSFLATEQYLLKILIIRPSGSPCKNGCKKRRP